MRRLLPALSLLLLGLAVPAAAQQDDGRWAAAEELLRTMNMEEVALEGAMVNLEGQIRATPEMEKYRDIMEDFFKEHLSWEAIGPQMVNLYAETFTEPELRRLTAFYRTPVGRKLVEVQPVLMQKGGAIGEAQVAEHQEELSRKIMERAMEDG